MKTKIETYAEIVCSSPWRDDDDGYWHLDHLWVYSRGKRVTYSISDNDGNHEPCSTPDARAFERDTPFQWEKYNQFVAETGEDPLGNFPVRRNVKVSRHVIVYLRPWIGMSTHGVAVTGARYGSTNKNHDPKDFPEWLASWLYLKEQGGVWYLDQVTDPETMLRDCACFGTLKAGWYVKDTITFDRPRPAATVARELRKAARERLLYVPTPATP